MKIRVLGCHGGDQSVETRGASRAVYRTCGFLIDDTVLLDAGTIGEALSLDEQHQIHHVLLTHLHFDHIRGLPTFADNIAEQAAHPVQVAGLAAVIKGLERHVFNDQVYPNFFTLPASRPILKPKVLESGQRVGIGHLSVTPILVNHLVPAVGFLISDGSSTVLYSGDTHVTEDIWRRAAADRALKAIFIETSFPDELIELATVSKHLTPSMAIAELDKVGRLDVPAYVYHMKPAYRGAIQEQFRRRVMPQLSLLEEGMELKL